MRLEQRGWHCLRGNGTGLSSACAEREKNCAEILPSIPSMTYRESGASVNDGQLNCLVRSQRICRYRSSPVSLQPQYRNLRNRGAGGWRVTVSVSSYACHFDVVPWA